MTISDETLMAYADGEADEAVRASVEAAMRDDPDIAKRIARHRAMRDAMQGAFSKVLAEPVPERLMAAARGQTSLVIDLAGARAASQRKSGGAPRRWQPAALAASLLLGLGVGYLTWHSSDALIQTNAGRLVAGGGLANALSGQLSNDRAGDGIAVAGLSFRSKSGNYCRTFSLSGPDSPSGLACREGNQWKIQALGQSVREETTNFRPAGSPLSPAIGAAVEESIEGEPLDRAAEIAARQSGWAAPTR
jgi:hypothetical protein